MSFLRLPEPVMVVVEPAVIVFGTTSLTTASVEASPQSLKDTAKVPASTSGMTDASPGRELLAGWLCAATGKFMSEPQTDCAAAFVMICRQMSLSPFEAVTFSVVVVVSKLAGKPALKVTATLGTPLMSPALIGKATGW